MAVKDTDYRYLKNKLDSFGLFLVPSQPTHHTSRETVVNGMSTIHESHTWLDLFIVQDSQSVLQYEKSDAPLIAGRDLIKLNYRLAGLISTKIDFLHVI